jgi:hypothetical protein
MAWLDGALDALAKSPVCGYKAQGVAASEPTALAALALAGHGRTEPAKKATAWLAKIQNRDGSVGVVEDQSTPGWPTALAMLAWRAVDQGETTSLARATAWTLASHGKPSPQHRNFGHDTTLVAWSWCEDTHSWIEPTAFFVMALKAGGKSTNGRTREAVKMLLDRQLPTGGCNYGNTVVLGQVLRSHMQSTGIVLLALAGESDAEGKCARAVKYLQGELSAKTTTSSLCWGLLGLAAFQESPPAAQEWLAAAGGQALAGEASPHKLALLALAALAERSPLVTLPQGNTTS